MFKFKVGDKVRVKKGFSAGSNTYHNKIGKIVKCSGTNSQGNFYNLDIDIRHCGIYEQELILFERIIRQYGVVRFLEGTNAKFKY